VVAHLRRPKSLRTIASATPCSWVQQDTSDTRAAELGSEAALITWDAVRCCFYPL
jgi:hypothetical protein